MHAWRNFDKFEIRRWHILIVTLKINFAKIQIMTNLVLSENIDLDGNTHQCRGDNQTCELYRRIGLTWAASSNLPDTLKSQLPVSVCH